MKKVALISTPWPLFNRPSVQLGSLKAFLKSRIPKLDIDNHHIYLSIAVKLGYDVYRKISESSWLSESLYGALVYPERKDLIKRFWNRYARRIFGKKKKDFEEIYEVLKKESDSILDNIDWNNYFLVGFSICFSQLTSSIYFIKKIKERSPKTKIVIGGCCCAGDLGKSLLDTYDEIDFVIQGEGELPLYHLVSSILSDNITPFPGIISKNFNSNGILQIERLDELPIPDYSDYFEQIRKLPKEKVFQPRLPMEISRGCWWGRCAFCNLNLQWKGYRAKSEKRVLEELKFLVEKYQTLSISFMDNLLPPSRLKELFSQICSLGKDLRLFAEIRANTPLDVLIMMKKAGMDEVQVGIEALSTKLLKKMNKGATAIQNIEIMKNCEAEGTPKLVGNLILQFPGSDEEDVKETLRNLEFVFPFRPLKGIPFWLGYGSYIWKNPSQFKINKVKNHIYYSRIFPPNILNKLTLMIQTYYGDVKRQIRMWRPLKKKLKEWENFYKDMHNIPKDEPILSYQDGGDFLIIRQRGYNNQNMIHKLKGLSRKIFLYCQKNRSISEILNYFSGLDELKLLPFLRMMAEKRLMFFEGDRYLSLAVPSKGWR